MIIKNKKLIDNVKLIIPNYVHGLPDCIEYNTLFNEANADIKKYIGDYKGLHCVLNNNNLMIYNSIHKFYSMLKDDISINYTRFTYSDAVETFNRLADLFKVHLKDMRIPQFEYGANLLIGRNPKDVLDGIIGYKPNQHRVLDRIAKGNEVKYESQLYDLKLYNKTHESNIKENILRVEIKRKSSIKYFSSIKTVQDLLCHDAFAELASDLLDKIKCIEFNKTKKMDTNNVKNINEYYRLKCLEACPENILLDDIKKKLPASTYKNESKRLKKLLQNNTFSESEMKQDILTKLDSELNDIIKG